MAHTSGHRFTKSFLIVLSFLFISRVQADIRQLPFSCFSISFELKLPGTPGVIYEAVTGDISGWWDHTFSEKPYPRAARSGCPGDRTVERVGFPHRCWPLP